MSFCDTACRYVLLFALQARTYTQELGVLDVDDDGELAKSRLLIIHDSPVYDRINTVKRYYTEKRSRPSDRVIEYSGITIVTLPRSPWIWR